MHLVQLLLPLQSNDGLPFPPEAFARVRDELIEQFGGITSYVRAPARGAWKEADGAPAVSDDIVVFEVMAGVLDPEWWAAYREALLERFAQEALVVRALPLIML